MKELELAIQQLQHYMHLHLQALHIVSKHQNLYKILLRLGKLQNLSNQIHRRRMVISIQMKIKLSQKQA